MANVIMLEPNETLSGYLAKALRNDWVYHHVVMTALSRESARSLFFGGRTFRDGGCNLFWTNLRIISDVDGLEMVEELRRTWPEMPAVFFVNRADKRLSPDTISRITDLDRVVVEGDSHTTMRHLVNGLLAQQNKR